MGARYRINTPPATEGCSRSLRAMSSMRATPYREAMDCLKPGDIAIFATPPAFRWVHFTYAIQKGLNVFMEKPLTADGPTSRRMLALAQDASARNLKVGVGLMSRHSRALQELADRVHNGEIGEQSRHKWKLFREECREWSRRSVLA